jgi:glycosyltransferase involved in cell wall biosynthesis
MPDFNGKILLLANYLPDHQESMQRFAQMLFDGLRKREIPAELIRPQPVFGRFAKGSAHKWLAYFDKFVLFPRHLKRALRKQNYLLHICDHSNAIYTKYARHIPLLVTCHDLLAIRSAIGEFPQNRTRQSGRIFQTMIVAGLQRARRIACVSNATRHDLLGLTRVKPAQTTIIHNGLNYPYAPMEKKPAATRVAALMENAMESNPDSFILHVGGNQWYKNRPGVVEIYHELLRHYSRGTNAPSLLLVGKPWPHELRVKVERAGLDEQIIEIHIADNEDLRALYSTAEALLFPSLAEGFGWPIIEAQACGCPVITSNRAPMTEVAGAAAFFIDPKNIPDAARSLQKFLTASDLEKSTLREKGFQNAARFNTDEMIDHYIREYSSLSAPSAKSAVHL